MTPLGFGASYLARYVALHGVDISDYLVFPAHQIEAAPPEFHFASPQGAEALVPALDRLVFSVSSAPPVESIHGYLARNGTVAFLVIQHDRLLFEHYYNGYTHDSICTSFSVAKSFASALIGLALHENLIRGLEDPLPRYLPELTASYWSKITIRHLVSMSSGLAYDAAGFLPWNDSPRIYYGLDLRTLALHASRREAPGLHFHYNNYNLVLLGMILERVTDGSVSHYLQEKVWKPLGMEHSASWSLDSSACKMEKMESGLNARAVDFAKFARLYLRRGDWNGVQVIPEAWVAESTTVSPAAPWKNYKYLWWIPGSGVGRFMAVGNLGQFIYVAPDKDCIILRFGRGRPRDWKTSYVNLFGRIAEML